MGLVKKTKNVNARLNKKTAEHEAHIVPGRKGLGADSILK